MDIPENNSSEAEKIDGRGSTHYGAGVIDISIDIDDVLINVHKQRVIAKGFIMYNYDTIKKISAHPQGRLDEIVI